MSETFNKARQAALASLQSIRDALVHVNDGKAYFESEIAQLQSDIQRVRMEQRGYKAICDSAHNLVNTLRAAVVQGLIPDNDGDHLMAELAARKMGLFYWKGKRDSEFEFILGHKGVAIPLDVKRTRGNLNSLNEFRNHNKKGLAVKVSANQYGYDEDQMLLTLPFYYVPFFLDDLQKGEINEL